MNEKELRAMEISESSTLGDHTGVLRVPTGWIYYRWNEKKQDYYSYGTFVPFDPNYINL